MYNHQTVKPDFQSPTRTVSQSESGLLTIAHMPTNTSLCNLPQARPQGLRAGSHFLQTQPDRLGTDYHPWDTHRGSHLQLRPMFLSQTCKDVNITCIQGLHTAYICYFSITVSPCLPCKRCREAASCSIRSMMDKNTQK